MRIALVALGWVFVAIGAVGIFVPLLPTFDFLLLASICFAKSSSRFEKWLVTHPRLGPPLRAWREERSISRKHKVYSTAMICASVAVLVFGLQFSVFGKIAVAAFGSVLVWFILSRRTRLPLGQCPLRVEGDALASHHALD